MARKTTRASEYFATLQDPVQLASEMQEKIRIWRQWCSDRGLTSLWSRKLKNYYGISSTGNSSQSVSVGGTEGELLMIKINDLNNLVRNQLVMVTSQRPAGIARAVNSDVESLKSSRIGTAIAEYYMSQVGFESKFVSATETALLCDEAYIDLFWDKSSGDPIAVNHETGQPEMSGDCILRTHAPWNVARDPGLTIEQQKWHIITYRLNRWDAASMYPKFSESIQNQVGDDLPEIPINEEIPSGSDSIYAHLLVHDRTAAVPEGRYALMIGDDIVMDSRNEIGMPALPYKDYPVERIAPANVIDGAIGYSSANDILAMEEVTDALHSVITTNQVTFGGQSMVGPTGSNINVVDIAKGVRYFELPPDLVNLLKPLNMLHTPPEIFNYINMLNSKKEQSVGVNSVVRGQPEGQLSGASGSALALIQAQAISFNSGIQRSYFSLLSGAMTKLIGILRVYADTPRVAKIVGKSKASGLKEFKYTGRDLNSISSIVYEMVNPISQSFGGRLTLAQDLLKAGQIKSPKQYINVVTTGQTDVLTEDDESDALLILEENESLTEGKQVQAIITEIHADHIKSHMSVLSSLEAKGNPDLVANTLGHIQEHIDLWMSATQTNPAILMVTGQQPLMPPAPPAQNSMMGGASGAPSGGPIGLPKLMGSGEVPPIVAKAGEISPAQLPNIAGSNQKPSIPGVTA